MREPVHLPQPLGGTLALFVLAVAVPAVSADEKARRPPIQKPVNATTDPSS